MYRNATPLIKAWDGSIIHVAESAVRTGSAETISRRPVSPCRKCEQVVLRRPAERRNRYLLARLLRGIQRQIMTDADMTLTLQKVWNVPHLSSIVFTVHSTYTTLIFIIIIFCESGGVYGVGHPASALAPRQRWARGKTLCGLFTDREYMA